METRDEDSIILNDNQTHYMIHPGEILREELKERGIKQKDLAKGIGMEPPHLSALIHGNRNITAAIAAKLESVLNIPASVWLNLQNQYNVGKSRMRNNNTSSVVDGYSKMSSPCAVLGEQ